MTKTLHMPLSGNEMPRFAGPATMMRLPLLPSAAGLDACFVGVPFDIGTSNRPGARLAPRMIRGESAFLRPANNATRAVPFESLAVADIGDVAINTFHLEKSVRIIEDAYADILAHGCRPITIGGDHTITLPILRTIHRRHGPVALVHIDAHADVNLHHFGEPVTHGTTFRRAAEEGLLIKDRVYQIGLRATGWSAGEFDWPREQGFRVVEAHEVWYKSLDPLMEEVRGVVADAPVYLTFDIDGLDPSCAPGTGSPEPGGLTLSQGMEAIRGVRGLDLVGADLVEVSPIYDVSGNTSLTAANLLFEMLCVLPGVEYR
jgi:guanidinobutyrase